MINMMQRVFEFDERRKRNGGGGVIVIVIVVVVVLVKFKSEQKWWTKTTETLTDSVGGHHAPNRCAERRVHVHRYMVCKYACDTQLPVRCLVVFDIITFSVNYLHFACSMCRCAFVCACACLCSVDTKTHLTLLVLLVFCFDALSATVTISSGSAGVDGGLL